MSSQEVGITFPHPQKGIQLGLIFGIILGTFNTVSGYFFAGSVALPSNHLLDSAAFQAFVPALSEELLFRGFFFALLVHYLSFDDETKLFSIYWSIALVSILFIGVHLIDIDLKTRGWNWKGNLEVLIYLFSTTLALAYLRLSTDSIWPCVICHSFANSIPFIASLAKNLKN